MQLLFSDPALYQDTNMPKLGKSCDDLLDSLFIFQGSSPVSSSSVLCSLPFSSFLQILFPILFLHLFFLACKPISYFLLSF